MASEAHLAQTAAPPAPRRVGDRPQQRSEKQMPQKLLQQRLHQQQLQKLQLQQQQQRQMLQQKQLYLQQQQQQQQQQPKQKQKQHKVGLEHHHKPRQKQPPQPSPPPISQSDPNKHFHISTWPRNQSLYRSLNSEPENNELQVTAHSNTSEPPTERHTPASTAATPKQNTTSKPDLPVCSNRGRAPFGEFTWACDVVRKDGEGPTATATGAAASSAAATPSSPTAPLAGSNGGSLRASIFKKSSALVYGGTSSPSQRDTDTTDKEGRPKPWHMEVPPGIPYYYVPPPGRRFGGLAKAAGRNYAQSPTQGPQGGPSGRPSGGSTAAGGAGSQFGNARSNSNTNFGANSNARNNVNANNAGGAAANNRLQKPMIRYMDFNPWKGRHPEDRFTEATVRGGHYDRLQTSQSHSAETNSARGWLPLLLKQKHSTAMLGQALALANALSREKNHIAPASQFKLPPRVTVTDTRRETWLRDLTNSSIPLRKLSRTIPHGLRGKVLLEQCMLKSVPIDRAMWLARCVGAQELRAFKRKGTSTVVTLAESELRWLKEWTLTVQQFLEAFLVELDLEKAAGRDRLQYAARFARQLYLERLLDHDQFLNWMLTGLRNAARLPAASSPTPYFDLWVFVIQEYFHGIMQRRKTSSHLAVTVLSRLEYLSQFQTATVSSAQAQKLLKTMVRGHPDAFVSQAVWPRYEKLLTSLLLPPSSSSASDHPSASLDAVSTIRHRNNYLRLEMSAEMEQVIDKLLPLDEAIRRPVNFSTHFAKFLRLDKKEVVPFVIRWCASIHRPGLAKVYIAARLISELCQGDAKLATHYILAFLSSDRRNEAGQQNKEPANGRNGSGKEKQKKLQVFRDKQSEGSKALYQLVGLLIAQDLFLPAHYLASLILQSRPSDVDEIVPDGRSHVRLAAELPVHLLERSTSSLRANHLRRLGYDTDFEADDIDSILREVQAALDAFAPMAAPETPADTPAETPAANSVDGRPSRTVSLLARCIEERSRNVKMAVADWLDKNVVSPMRVNRQNAKTEAAVSARASLSKPGAPAAPAIENPDGGPAQMSLENVNAIRVLIEKTDDLSLLADFILEVASSPQTTSVMALCADTVNLHLSAFLALGNARLLYDKVMSRALAITVGVDTGATTAFQTLLPAGTDLRVLALALPALAEKMPPPGPGSLVLGINRQPVRVVPKALRGVPVAPAEGEDGVLKKHFEVGLVMASEIQARLLDIDQRLCVATYDADCSPLSDGRGPHVLQEDAAADEVREEMVKIASSGNSVDNATMDRLFGTIAMISQERWRRLQPDGDEQAQSRSRNDLRLSGNLFSRLRRFNSSHFDSIMVKWLKRLRTMRDRPPIGTIYPVFVVFGCLDLASLMATTADEQPREPGAMIQSPARNTWRTSYLQDVLSLLSVPISDSHPMLTADECQRFLLFQHEAPFVAPASIAALVRNAVAEMTLWRHHQRQGNQGLAVQPIVAPRKPIDALSVSRLLRTAAVADAPAAAHALAKTTDQTVRSGLWEMMTLALTRQVLPSRSPLEMLRGLDVFAADVGQLALGLVVSPGPYTSVMERAKEADNLANLILRAVSEFQFSGLCVLHSLPADMATSLKDHAQARFLDMIPTRKQTTGPTGPGAMDGVARLETGSNFHVASGFLDIVRTIVLTQQQQYQKKLQQLQQQQQQAAAAAAATNNNVASILPPFSPGVLPASGIPPLDASVVDKLGELWCRLQEPTTGARRDGDFDRINSMKQAILRDWLPALLSLILLHLPNRDALLNTDGGSAMGGGGIVNTVGGLSAKGGSPSTFAGHTSNGSGMVGLNIMTNLGAVASNNNTSNSPTVSGNVGLPRTSRDLEQESVHAGACIALASLCMEVSSLADDDSVTESDTSKYSSNSGHLALQSRLFDTALLLADGLSEETRLHCVRILRDASAAATGSGGIGPGGDLPPILTYILSCPISGSIYYPRLYLERLPSMPLFSRPPPGPPRDWSQSSNASNASDGGTSQSQQPGAPTSAPGPLKRMAASMGFGGMLGNDRNKRVRFGLKTWDAVSDPSPAVQDNDTAVNLWLLEATKVLRQRRR